jgi:integrase
VPWRPSSGAALSARARKAQTTRALKRRLEFASSGELSSGYLRRKTIKPATQKRYLKAYNSFKSRCLQLKLKTTTDAEIDLALDQVVVDEFLDGHLQQQARNMIYGTAWALSKPANLFPLAKSSLQGFEAVAPSAMIDPATWEEALLISEGLLNLRTRHGIKAAAGCLIQFDAYLRPSELLMLRSQAVHPPCRGMTSGPHQWAIVIAPSTGPAKTKTKQQDDTLLMGQPGREWIADVLEALFKKTTPSGRLLDMTQAEYGILVSEASVNAGLPKRITPHQFRHGGASLDSLNKVDVLTVQLRGRWAQQRSLLRYMKPGRYFRRVQALSNAQLGKAHGLNKSLGSRLVKAILQLPF